MLAVKSQAGHTPYITPQGVKLKRDIPLRQMNWWYSLPVYNNDYWLYDLLINDYWLTDALDYVKI